MERRLKCKSDGIQVWDRCNSFCNLGEAFCNRKSSKESWMILLTTCYNKMYGDCIQCAYLVVCFFIKQGPWCALQCWKRSQQHCLLFPFENKSIEFFPKKWSIPLNKICANVILNFEKFHNPLFQINNYINLLQSTKFIFLSLQCHDTYTQNRRNIFVNKE